MERLADQGSLRLSAEAGEREEQTSRYSYDSRPGHRAQTWGRNQRNEGGEDEKSRAEIAVNLRLDGPTREDPNPCQRAQNMIGVTGK